MSKEEEARVRDELLQSLYAGVLRLRLVRSQLDSKVGGRAAPPVAEGVAAGLAANLEKLDLVALPQRGGMALRVLRGAAGEEQSSSPARDRRAGVLTLPPSEAAAIAFLLGASTAAVHGDAEAVVLALLPPSAGMGQVEAPASKARTVTPAVTRMVTRGAAREARLPETWAGLGSYAAQHALPLLFVSDGMAGVAGPGPEQPPTAFPTIPVDRDDALAVYRVAFECISRARRGGGPSHLACVAFRPRGGKAEESNALIRLESTLRARGAFGASWRKGLERRLIRELSGA